MGCEVYANGDEIACKAGDGKVIAAFPDVCLSPPSPPAGPIPVPYPDTSFSKDMQNGSKTVMIKDKEVMLKDHSFYQTSPLGDETATKGLGAGVVTHVITGKTYFVAWSMDVQFEGQNVDRHTDLTTSNHASPIANVPAPFPNMAAFIQAMVEAGICPCCKGLAHSKGPVITEEQFYGADMVVGENAAGETVGLEADQNTAKFLRETRQGPCKDLLPEPPCNVYHIASKPEHDKIEKNWNNHRIKYKQQNNIPAGTPVGHRTPKVAGGCPRDPGNLAVAPGCEDVEQELSRRQGVRATALRNLNAVTIA